MSRKRTTLSLREVANDSDYHVMDMNRNNNDPKRNNNVSIVFGKILLAIYFFLALSNISSFVAVIFLFGSLQFYVMIGTVSSILITSACGYYGIYKFGTIQDHLETLRENGIFYEEEQQKLSETRERLKRKIEAFESDVEQMNAHSNKLKADEQKFSVLNEWLNEIAAVNEDKMHIVDKCNDSLQRMGDLIRCNHRTYLLCCYYEAALRDKDISMNEREYENFLCRVTKKWRAKFMEMGSFEQLWHSKQISVAMFEQIVDKILDKNRDLMETEFDRQYSSQRIVCLSPSEHIKLNRMNSIEMDESDTALLRKDVQRSATFEDFAQRSDVLDELDVEALRAELNAHPKEEDKLIYIGNSYE